jgi:hypothetical protein
MLQKEKREQEQKSREDKKAEDRVAFEKKKAELYKELENDLQVFGELGKGKLLSLLKYYFEDKTPNKSKKTRKDLVVLVQLALMRGTRRETRQQMMKASGQ